MYGTIEDLIERRGEAELIRLTTPEGSDMVAINAERVTRAMADASDLVDSYLRRRYQVPLAVPPASVVAAVCDLARYDLFDRADTAPTEQVIRARKERMAWLQALSKGEATLEGIAPLDVGAEAMASDRTPMFRAGGPLWLD